MTSPKPKAFVRTYRPRCFLCLEQDIATWIHECLEETKKAGGRRPTATLIHQEVSSTFPDRAPAHENSTRRHLTSHEPAFFEWDNERYG